MAVPATVEHNGARPLSLLSVVVVLQDRVEEAEGLHERLRAALQGVPYELVVVDDGSTDGTCELLDELAAEEPRLRVVHLARAFGPEAALTAGLDHAQGDVVVTLDGDLRDPPEAIELLLDQREAGAEVVYGVREADGEGGSRASSGAGWLARPLERLAGVELEPHAGELRLLDRRALDALGALRERERFLRGMTVWVGFTQSAVSYRPEPPLEGAQPARGGARQRLRRAFDAATSFSEAPLRAAAVAALLLGLLAVLAAPLVGIVALVTGSGAAAVIAVVLALAGAQLAVVGLVGEYVSRVYSEAKGRPLYVVRDLRNLPGAARGGAHPRERITASAL